jgi:tetratricopeptide (TPR) repeat protein
LTLGPEHSGDDTKRRYETALSLFKKFTEDYPQHPKRARALSIIGRLHFELQDFEQAIVVLRDQVKPADDPAAALSMLRYLARAYSMTGNYEQAETSYLQAATLPGNYNAEADYLELGDLFRQRAGLTKEPADREPLEAMAMSYWRRALQVPGLAPGDRNVLEERLQWLSFTDKAEGAASGAPAPAEGAANPESAPALADPAVPAPGMPEGEGAAEATVPPAVPAEEGPTPAVSSIPVAADEAGRAEVPGAELEALVPAVTPAGE